MMPAATTKHDLITICDRDFAKLTVLLDGLTTRDALAEDPEGWSIKDVVLHRAHWVHLTLGWAHAGRHGQHPEMPAPGYKWNDLKRYNAELKTRQAGISWPAARDALREAHLTLMREIDALDEGALYGGPMPGAKNHWPTGRYLEACGASHYRSAAKFIRKQQREAKRAARLSEGAQARAA